MKCFTYYLCHAQEIQSATKVRAVFYAPAKSANGVSLNVNFLVGPTIHSILLDVLLRFCTHILSPRCIEQLRSLILTRLAIDLCVVTSLVDYRMMRVNIYFRPLQPTRLFGSMQKILLLSLLSLPLQFDPKRFIDVR